MDSGQCWLCALSSLVLSVSPLGFGGGVREGKELRERGRAFLSSLACQVWQTQRPAGHLAAPYPGRARWTTLNLPGMLSSAGLRSLVRPRRQSLGAREVEWPFRERQLRYLQASGPDLSQGP